MSRFDDCIQHILDVEGGFVNDPQDSGGATKWGITLGFYRENVDASATVQDIKQLARGDAREIYREYFWHPANFAVSGSNYGDLPIGVDSFVLNLSINMGYKRGHTILQKALRSVGREIECDGWLGPQTTNAASKVEPLNLIQRIGTHAAAFYARIILRDRSQEKFLEGWMYRAFSEATRSVQDLEQHNAKDACKST